MHARSRRAALLALASLIAAGCRTGDAASLDPARRAAIADTLTAMIHAAYDLKANDVVARLMSLYPDTGRVISSSGGRVTTTRDSLEAGIRSFWEYVGRNMQDPKWMWGPAYVDVFSPNAAVLTTTYRVPHRTPAGAPHIIAGAWTAAFERRGGKWVIVQEHLSEMPPEALAADSAAAANADPHAGHTSP